MTRLHETIETRLPIDEAFAYIADFANASAWDPGVRASTRIDAGPVAVGSRYALEVALGGRTAPMEYRVTTLDPGRRVVLVGAGGGITAVDTIEFGPADDGTRIEYTADIRLGGLLRLAQPFLGGSFDRVAKAALGGMKRVLDERAASRA